MDNYLILSQHPLKGFMPDDVRNWLSLNFNESNLAIAMELVNLKAGMLMHECDEVNDPWVDYCFHEWWELQLELKDTILQCLEHENKEKGTQFQLDGAGFHYLIKPFMERNGYRDGSGWWIKNE